MLGKKRERVLHEQQELNLEKKEEMNTQEGYIGVNGQRQAITLCEETERRTAGFLLSLRLFIISLRDLVFANRSFMSKTKVNSREFRLS